MNNKANELLAAGDRLSKRQQEAIAKNVNANVDRLVETSMFNALIADRVHSEAKKGDT